MRTGDPGLAGIGNAEESFFNLDTNKHSKTERSPCSGHDATRGTATDEITLPIPAIHANGGRLFARLAATEN